MKDRKLSCLVRVGTKLEGNQVLPNIGFVPFPMFVVEAVAFTCGQVTPGGKAELLVANGEVTY